MLRFFVFLLLAVPGFALKAEEPSAPPPCSSPEYRQFDFWLGHWTSYNNKREVQGTNHLHKVVGDCGMQENWTGRGGGYTGKSFNFYDQQTGTWHQTWIDNQGGHLFLSGGVVDGSMQLSGPRTNPDGETVTDRITWTPLDDGRVRQHWEVSKDGGETWADLFDGYYERDTGE